MTSPETCRLERQIAALLGSMKLGRLALAAAFAKKLTRLLATLMLLGAGLHLAVQTSSPMPFSVHDFKMMYTRSSKRLQTPLTSVP